MAQCESSVATRVVRGPDPLFVATGPLRANAR